MKKIIVIISVLSVFSYNVLSALDNNEKQFLNFLLFVHAPKRLMLDPEVKIHQASQVATVLTQLQTRPDAPAVLRREYDDALDELWKEGAVLCTIL